MPARRQAAEIKRRIPRQARAAETAETILEGAAQILEANGLAGFTTNAVAERAGVSIGTLYQYFADKNAILLALAKQQVGLGLADIARALSGEIDPTPEGRVRAMVRAAIHAFRGRQRARKAVMEAVLTQGHHAELMAAGRRLHRPASCRRGPAGGLCHDDADTDVRDVARRDRRPARRRPGGAAVFQEPPLRGRAGAPGAGLRRQHHEGGRAPVGQRNVEQRRRASQLTRACTLPCLSKKRPVGPPSGPSTKSSMALSCHSASALNRHDRPIPPAWPRGDRRARPTRRGRRQD